MSDQSEQLKSIAGQVLSGNALDSFVANCLMAAFTDKDGNVDEEKVMGHLTAIYAAGQPAQPPGDNARAALKRRHGVATATTNQPASVGQIRRGSNARTELAKRYGRKS